MMTNRPTTSQIADELARETYKRRYKHTLLTTLYSLITVAAVAILIATLYLPVLEIYGESMTPTLYEGDIVASIKQKKIESGDIVSFYYNNKILVKRAIAFSGDWVNIDEKGNLYVNGEMLEEDYVSEKDMGECDIQLPYQVPDEKIFVVGDHRSTSIDSRSKTVGCISEEQIVGIIKFRVWPLQKIGPL